LIPSTKRTEEERGERGGGEGRGRKKKKEVCLVLKAIRSY
jgi:hypothetical protein